VTLTCSFPVPMILRLYELVGYYILVLRTDS
jgi:hypothetical protein